MIWNMFKPKKPDPAMVRLKKEVADFEKLSQFMLRQEASERGRYLTYDKAGGVTVDLSSYLRSPYGRAQLESIKRLRR